MSVGTLKTRVCEMLGIEYPVLCAGMGSYFFNLKAVTGARLAAAVSEAGGLGVIGGAMMSLDELADAIREVRRLTSKPFGVDLLLPSSIGTAVPMAGFKDISHEQIIGFLPKEQRDFVEKLREEIGVAGAPVTLKRDATTMMPREAVQICLEQKVPVFAAGLGDPAFMVKEAHDQGMVVIGLVGNVKNAKRIVESGVDVVVAQGTEAGGHTGRVGTLALVPQVVDAVSPVPVLAAGGIGDGRGLAAALALGAEGAWVGTAFLATDESDEFESNKQKVVQADEEGTQVTKIFTGKTMRGIKCGLMRKWEEAKMRTLPMPLQTLLVAELVGGLIEDGGQDHVAGPAGQVCGMIKEIRPARAVLEDIVAGAIRVLNQDIRQRVDARAAPSSRGAPG